MKNKIMIALFIIGAILLGAAVINKMLHRRQIDLVFKAGLIITGAAILLSLLKMFDKKEQETLK